MFNDDNDDEFDGMFRPFDEIEIEFEKAKRGEPNNMSESDYEFIIEYYRMEQDAHSTNLAVQMATELFPLSTAIMISKAEWLTEQAKYNQALKVLDTIILLEPNCVDAIFIRIEILTETNRHEDAIKHCEDSLPLLEFSEFQCDLLMEKADIYDDIEEYDEVYKTLKEVLQINVQHDEALFRICYWADVTNNLEDAIKLYTAALEENPFHVTAHYNMGNAYQGLKKYKQAVEYYINTLDLDDKHEYAYRNLGDTYIALRQYDNAIETLSKYMEFGNTESEVLSAIAFCYEKKNDLNATRKYLREAAILNPNSSETIFKIAHTFIVDKDWKQAATHIEAAIALNPREATFHLALADCLMQQDKISEAFASVAEAICLKPKDKYCWMALILMFYMGELYDDAIISLDDAVKLCGNKVEFLYLRSAVLLKQGKLKAAKQLLEEALETNSNKISIYKSFLPELCNHPTIVEVAHRYNKKI